MLSSIASSTSPLTELVEFAAESSEAMTARLIDMDSLPVLLPTNCITVGTALHCRPHTVRNCMSSFWRCKLSD